MSRKYYRRRNGGSSKGFNVMQIVLYIVTIALLISVVPMLAAIAGSPILRPTEPVDDGMITFQLFGTLEHAYQCDGCSGNGYVTYTCAEGTTWEEFIGEGSTPISRGETEIYVTYTMDGGGHDCYTLPDVVITDVIIAGAKYGSPDLCTK